MRSANVNGYTVEGILFDFFQPFVDAQEDIFSQNSKWSQFNVNNSVRGTDFIFTPVVTQISPKANFEAIFLDIIPLVPPPPHKEQLLNVLLRRIVTFLKTAFMPTSLAGLARLNIPSCRFCI